MIPVLTPDEVRALDAAAAEPTDVLVRRAGHAVFRAALDLLGGTYGRRVTLLAGPGNNGSDGRVAAELLVARGVRVHTVDISRAAPPPPALGPTDLVIDAAFGTGFTGTWHPPLPVPGTPVLAVDIPSGLDGGTGLVPEGSGALRATRTVTFAALRPGHLFGRGPELCGPVTVADIGLDAAARSRAVVLTDAAVRVRLPRRDRTDHKWRAALGVVAGSPGMTGAPLLVAEAALRAGAGMVRLGTPGGLESGTEAVAVPLPAAGWAVDALAMLARCGSLVIGPGLGRAAATGKNVRQLLGRAGVPTVVDGDALGVLAQPLGAAETLTAARRGAGSHDEARAMLKAAFTGGSVPAGREAGPSHAPMLPGQRAVLQATARRLGADPRAVAATGRADRASGSADLDAAVRALAGRTAGTTVLTPHDGEFARITGAAPGADRIAAARGLAAGTGTVVLLKGPTTVVASPDGWVELVTAGDERLATAGSGDVLAGVIGAFLALGVAVHDAAALGAHVHAAAAVAGGRRHGLIASDLPGLVADWLSG